jgi:hypothetical protein
LHQEALPGKAAASPGTSGKIGGNDEEDRRQRPGISAGEDRRQSRQSQSASIVTILG